MALPMKTAMKKASAMKASAMKSKAMKAMKKKAISTIARGKRAKVAVFKGSKEKTSTGLHKTDLMKNKSGRVVTKKQHAKGKALFQQFAKKWLEACMQARKELGLKGFCAIGGKSAQGKALYAKAKALSDDDTDVESGSSPDYEGEEDWDAEAGFGNGQESRGKATPTKECPKVEIPLPPVSPSAATSQLNLHPQEPLYLKGTQLVLVKCSGGCAWVLRMAPPRAPRRCKEVPRVSGAFADCPQCCRTGGWGAAVVSGGLFGQLQADASSQSLHSGVPDSIHAQFAVHGQRHAQAILERGAWSRWQGQREGAVMGGLSQSVSVLLGHQFSTMFYVKIPKLSTRLSIFSKGEDVWLLLDFVDFAEASWVGGVVGLCDYGRLQETWATALRSLPAGVQHLEDLEEALGARAAELFEHFVESARDGAAGFGASAARNSLAQDYSFALLGRREARAVARVLRERGVHVVVDPMAGTGLHARLLSDEGLGVVASDARPGTPRGLCWHPVSQRLLEAAPVPAPEHTGSALFLSWPPRSEAATAALRSFGGPMLVVVGDRGQWHGSAAFHRALEEDWEVVAEMDIVTWPRLQDMGARGLRATISEKSGMVRFTLLDLRLIRRYFSRAFVSWDTSSSFAVEGFKALEALPALSAAAAAAAFDAAGIQPEVLQSLLKEHQRFAGAVATEVPAPSGPVGPNAAPPLVISVSEALASTEESGVATPKTKTTVMLRNLPNNYTRSMVLNLLNQEGFKGKIDFLYLPVDFRSKAGLGYAFVNLVEPCFVPQFWKAFDGFTKWVFVKCRARHGSSLEGQLEWSSPGSAAQEVRPLTWGKDFEEAGNAKQHVVRVCCLDPARTGPYTREFGLRGIPGAANTCLVNLCIHAPVAQKRVAKGQDPTGFKDFTNDLHLPGLKTSERLGLPPLGGLCAALVLLGGRSFIQVAPLAAPRVFSTPRCAVEAPLDPDLLKSATEELAELEERAARDDADAQFRLGQLLRKGRVVEKDMVRAFQLVLSAAEQEHVRAQYLIGLMLIRGEGCEIDEETGVNFVLMAAEDGLPAAQHAMAKIYLTGVGPQGKDLLSGVYWLKQAAARDHLQAQLMLGNMLLSGNGVRRNATLAGDYFLLAAKKGSDEAQEVVGQMFRTGTGFDQDKDSAMAWMSKAAEQGRAEACIALASMYRKGEGSVRDAATALHYFKKAAEAGSPDGANELAVMYLTGEGTLPNEEASAYWFQRATELEEHRRADEEYHVMKASPMKAKAKAMKGMKVMKKKAVSNIARGKLAKMVVFKGRKEKTSTGLQKTHLMKNKRGKVVTKKQHAVGVALFKKIGQRWLEAVTTARKELGIKGFCPVGGKSAQGKALYAKAKALYAA
ncbi:ybeQ [Symbiodinium natans]|uniref:YbeQ protein n=1 Tax=Symbiodinium natans TaxID=878477 RepID=A0A812NF82_9DINO|nr:ybeQ [Symbiodinium natans]